MSSLEVAFIIIFGGLGLFWLASMILGFYIVRDWEKTRKQKAREKETLQRQRAHEKEAQKAWRAITARDPEGFNRELTRALAGSKASHAVELVRPLPAPINQQAIDVIRAIDELKKAAALAAGSGPLEPLIKVTMDAATDLEIDLCKIATEIFLNVRTVGTLDYNQLPDSTKLVLITHSDALKELLHLTRKARAYQIDATSNMSIKEKMTEKSEWINSYHPINDPEPGRYLES